MLPVGRTVGGAGFFQMKTGRSQIRRAEDRGEIGSTRDQRLELADRDDEILLRAGHRYIPRKSSHKLPELTRLPVLRTDRLLIGQRRGIRHRPNHSTTNTQMRRPTSGVLVRDESQGRQGVCDADAIAA